MSDELYITTSKDAYPTEAVDFLRAQIVAAEIKKGSFLDLS